MNTLRNANFEADWSEEKSHRCLRITADEYRWVEVGNIFNPPGWTPWFYHSDTYAQPEGRDARATDPPRMRSGEKGYLLFTFSRAHWCGLFQQVETEPDTVLSFSIWLHAWSNHKDANHPDWFPHPDDAKWSEGAGYERVGWRTDTLEMTGEPQQDAKRNFAFAIGIDPLGGVDPFAESVIWSDEWSIYNGYVKKLEVEATAAADTVTVFVRSLARWPFKHNDAYMDDAELVVVESPPGGPCRGAPREQYARVYHVLPQGTTLERFLEVAALVYPQRATIGFSYDDAGIGDLDDRIAVLWDIKEAEVPDYKAFFAEHYPGVTVRFENIIKPDTPPADPLAEQLSIHLQTEESGWLEYLAAVKPEWVKLVGNIEAARKVKAVSPATKVLYRQHIEHQQPYLDSGNANAFLATFWDSLVANAAWVDAIEGLNETIGTHDINGIKKAVAFEVALSDELARRDIGVAACLLNTAIGNPDHGAEVELLLPAARAAVRNKGWLGYHPYFPAHPDYAEAWLDAEGLHFHLRALLSWDPAFSKHGVYPRYLFTESGACGATPRADGRPGPMNANAGWRYSQTLNGDLDRYIKLLLRWRDQVAAWNKTHGNRAQGAMIFTTGASYVGWPDFMFNGYELSILAASLVAQ